MKSAIIPWKPEATIGYENLIALSKPFPADALRFLTTFFGKDINIEKWKGEYTCFIIQEKG